MFAGNKFCDQFLWQFFSNEVIDELMAIFMAIFYANLLFCRTSDGNFFQMKWLMSKGMILDRKLVDVYQEKVGFCDMFLYVFVCYPPPAILLGVFLNLQNKPPL